MRRQRDSFRRGPHVSAGMFLACLAITLSFAGSARADTLFGTIEAGPNQSIVKITMDPTTGTATFTTEFSASNPDSLAFALGGIVYTNLGGGTVVLQTGSSNITLATGIGGPADLAVTPDGTHVLVSGFTDGTIWKVSLSGGGKTPFATGLGEPQGIVFTPDGRLFANVGIRTSDGSSQEYIAQLDPTTGAILSKTGFLHNLDGLTYDPGSGMLFAGQTFGNGFFEVNPNNLTGVNMSNVTILGANLTDLVDGIAADGLGNIFYVGEPTGGPESELFAYNVSSQTFTHSAAEPNLDDIAPIIGPGAPPAVPEPSSLLLLGTGLLGLGATIERRRISRMNFANKKKLISPPLS